MRITRSTQLLVATAPGLFGVVMVMYYSQVTTYAEALQLTLLAAVTTSSNSLSLHVLMGY